VIRSMTGFGDASTTIDGVHYFVEVRSLNSKYFKANIRLPEEFQGLEAELESELRQRISRGTVTLTGKSTDESASAALEINHRALDRYVSQAREAAAVTGGEIALDFAALLTLPGVLQPPTDDEARIERARKAFRELLQTSCLHLISMRQREGMLLLEELRGHREYIAERLEKMKTLAPGVVREYETRLRTRIDTMLKDAGVQVEPVEMIREIAGYAERTDVAEELSRLGGHIEQFSELIESTDERPIGRTLDFLAQEMLREANTIASKTPDADMSRLIVEVKGAIDRIKEQVQNVE